MDRKIPIYFDSVIIESPFQEISDKSPNLGRLKVGVFTKFGNRNGSYITEAVANQLIESATNGMTPVVGFFDPETKTWASHTGPTLANAYGYVESFLGWEPFTDTDGITRDYAVFSVILFTNYFDEAKNITGQYQSMELDPESITGDWADINGEYYYVYKTAQMLGFCIIGEHEPCFSVSSFFSKNDDTYKSQYEKFSSLLFDLKAQVEEAEKFNEGGEQPMNEFENQEVVETQVEETPVEEQVTSFEAEETAVVTEEETVENEVEAVVEETIEENEVENNTEFELLQNQFNELQTSYNELQTNYENAQNRINELEAFQVTANTEIENLRVKNEELQTTINNYAAQAIEIENQRKNELVDKYEKVFDAEEITTIRNSIKDFSYDELESKLAIQFANQQLAHEEEVKKVPLIEPQESQFALLMKNYRKN